MHTLSKFSSHIHILSPWFQIYGIKLVQCLSNQLIFLKFYCALEDAKPPESWHSRLVYLKQEKASRLSIPTIVFVQAEVEYYAGIEGAEEMLVERYWDDLSTWEEIELKATVSSNFTLPTADLDFTFQTYSCAMI